MALLWALRIALYLQLAMGLARFFGLLTNQRVWELHVGLGVLIVVLALVGLRKRAEVPESSPRQAARLLPVLTLALGLLMWFNLIEGIVIVLVHMVLGIATVGAVEMAIARQKRALRAPAGEQASGRAGE